MSWLSNFDYSPWENGCFVELRENACVYYISHDRHYSGDNKSPRDNNEKLKIMKRR